MFTYAAYADIKPVFVLETNGDVEARFNVRVQEVYESIKLIERGRIGELRFFSSVFDGECMVKCVEDVLVGDPCLRAEP